MDALVDFQMDVTLDGEKLSAAEIKRLLAHSDGLVLIRGKWVEVDHERLRRTLDRFEAIEGRAAADGLSFGEAMRMLAGAGIAENDSGGHADIDWSQTVAGPWLSETLAALRRPEGLARIDPGSFLHGTLRPYQLAGVQWLYFPPPPQFGARPADDMGYGKTNQGLAPQLVLKKEATDKRKPRPPAAAAPGVRQRAYA